MLESGGWWTLMESVLHRLESPRLETTWCPTDFNVSMLSYREILSIILRQYPSWEFDPWLVQAAIR